MKLSSKHPQTRFCPRQSAWKRFIIHFYLKFDKITCSCPEIVADNDCISYEGFRIHFSSYIMFTRSQLSARARKRGTKNTSKWNESATMLCKFSASLLFVRHRFRFNIKAAEHGVNTNPNGFTGSGARHVPG